VHVMDQWTRPGPDGKRVKTGRHGKGKRWLARWTDPLSHERSKAFTTKAEAEVFLADLAGRLQSGQYIDPSRGRTPFKVYRERWLATKAGLAESTRVWYAGIAEGRVAERWDDVPLSQITEAAFREWMAAIRAEVSASRTAGHRVVVRGVMDHAVADRALMVNPLAGVRPPKLAKKKPKPLSPEQVAAYVEALENPVPGTSKHARRTAAPESCERSACFGLVLLFSAIRFGEAVALDVGSLQGRRLLITESVATVGGKQFAADTKSHRQREVSLPQVVADRVRALSGDRTSGPLLPAPQGGRWHHGVWTRKHRKACADAGLGKVKVHALRHTAISLAIGAGADVKVLQRMAGHESATLTLDTYGDMLDERLDEVSDAMAPMVPPRSRHLKAL
jgi:integrase